MTRTEHSPIQVVNEGLRAWLMETGLRLQATDLMDAQASLEVRRSLLELLRVEAALVAAEEETVFPVLMEKAPYLICHFEQEHRQIAQLRQAVLNAESMTRHYASNEQVAGLRLAYTSYMAFVLQHGMREESILLEQVSADMQEGGFQSLGAEICGRLLRRAIPGMDRERRVRVWNGVAAWGPEFRKALMQPDTVVGERPVQERGRLVVAA